MMRLEKASGRMIKLFITGEDPRSLRTVELDNWSGIGIMGQAAYFQKALEREELKHSCIYLLVKTASEDDIPEVYIGESDDFSQRYPVSSQFPLERMDNFIVFTYKDENLTRAHVRWLELRIWEILNDHEGKVRIVNKSRPTGSNLPISEKASMVTFLGNMIYVLEALGFEFFGYEEETDSLKAESDARTEIAGEPLGYFTMALPSSDKQAEMEIIDGSYVLRTGSHLAKITTDSIPKGVRELRERLILEGALADSGATYCLKKDISFARPSPASALVKGRSSSGYVDWISKADQRPLGKALITPGGNSGR